MLPSVLPPSPLSLLRPAGTRIVSPELRSSGGGTSGGTLTPRSGSGVEVGEEGVQLVGAEQGLTPELRRLCDTNV